MSETVETPVQEQKGPKKKLHDILVYMGRGRYEVALVGAPDYDACFGLARSQVRSKYPEAKLRFVPSGAQLKRKTSR